MESLFRARRTWMAGMVAGAALASTGAAWAQAYPNKPIKFIITHAAGGLPDTVARIYAQRLSERLGQPVTVDNKPGANGMVAAQAMALAPKDGYTFMVTDGSTFSINPLISKSLSYDYKRDFVAVSLAARAPLYLAVHPKTPANNLRELIALAKSRKDAVAYASSGNGSAQHLAGALFESAAKVDMVHIPYKGGGPALNDVIGGQVPLFFGNLASTLQHVQAGKLRALAVTSGKRASALPDVPTLAEAGVSGSEIHEWNAIFAPAGTTDAVVEKLSDALIKAMDTPEVKARIAQLGGEVQKGGPKAAQDFIQAQMALWARVVKGKGIVVE